MIIGQPPTLTIYEKISLWRIWSIFFYGRAITQEWRRLPGSSSHHRTCHESHKHKISSKMSPWYIRREIRLPLFITNTIAITGKHQSLHSGKNRNSKSHLFPLPKQYKQFLLVPGNMYLPQIHYTTCILLRYTNLCAPLPIKEYRNNKIHSIYSARNSIECEFPFPRKSVLIPRPILPHTASRLNKFVLANEK